MEKATNGVAVPGHDSLLRCPWVGSTPEYIAYHDNEWGKPIHDERGLFERMMLEAFQSGLSWLIILRKRDGIRAAFADFEPDVVATYTEEDVARLLQDPRVIRNRQKILAAITNARATVALRQVGGLDALIWSFAQPDRAAPTSIYDVPGKSPESAALTKALKKAGFVFVGPTTAYAMMQAIGAVNDHLADCHAR